MFNLRCFPLIIALFFTVPIYSDEVEEIVVTALKRSSTVVDTPAAITAISSTEIEDKGITSMHDLKHLVPSMNFTNVLGAQNISRCKLSILSKSFPGARRVHQNKIC